jgi:hypothetical protein
MRWNPQGLHKPSAPHKSVCFFGFGGHFVRGLQDTQDNKLAMSVLLVPTFRAGQQVTTKTEGDAKGRASSRRVNSERRHGACSRVMDEVDVGFQATVNSVSQCFDDCERDRGGGGEKVYFPGLFSDREMEEVLY